MAHGFPGEWSMCCVAPNVPIESLPWAWATVTLLVPLHLFQRCHVTPALTACGFEKPSASSRLGLLSAVACPHVKQPLFCHQELQDPRLNGLACSHCRKQKACPLQGAGSFEWIPAFLRINPQLSGIPAELCLGHRDFFFFPAKFNVGII